MHCRFCHQRMRLIRKSENQTKRFYHNQIVWKCDNHLLETVAAVNNSPVLIRSSNARDIRVNSREKNASFCIFWKENDTKYEAWFNDLYSTLEVYVIRMEQDIIIEADTNYTMNYIPESVNPENIIQKYKNWALLI